MSAEIIANALPPHFVKTGSLFVTQPYGLRAAPVPETLVCTWYPGEGSCRDTWELYDDDGHTRDFERGACCRTRFETAQRDGGRLEIRVAAGEHTPGLPTTRTLRVAVNRRGISGMTVDGERVERDGEGNWSAPLGWGRETVIHIDYA